MVGTAWQVPNWIGINLLFDILVSLTGDRYLFNWFLIFICILFHQPRSDPGRQPWLQLKHLRHGGVGVAFGWPATGWLKPNKKTSLPSIVFSKHFLWSLEFVRPISLHFCTRLTSLWWLSSMEIDLVQSWAGPPYETIMTKNFEENYIFRKNIQVPKNYQQTVGEHLAAHGEIDWSSISNNLWLLPHISSTLLILSCRWLWWLFGQTALMPGRWERREKWIRKGLYLYCTRFKRWPAQNTMCKFWSRYSAHLSETVAARVEIDFQVLCVS